MVGAHKILLGTEQHSQREKKGKKGPNKNKRKAPFCLLLVTPDDNYKKPGRVDYSDPLENVLLASSIKSSEQFIKVYKATRTLEYPLYIGNGIRMRMNMERDTDSSVSGR